MLAITFVYYFLFSIPLFIIMALGVYKFITKKNSSVLIASLIGFLFGFFFLACVVSILSQLGGISTANEIAKGMGLGIETGVLLFVVPVVISTLLQWISFIGSYFYTQRKRFIAVFVFHILLIVIILGLAFSLTMLMNNIEGVSINVS